MEQRGQDLHASMETYPMLQRRADITSLTYLSGSMVISEAFICFVLEGPSENQHQALTQNLKTHTHEANTQPNNAMQ